MLNIDPDGLADFTVEFPVEGAITVRAERHVHVPNLGPEDECASVDAVPLEEMRALYCPHCGFLGPHIFDLDGEQHVKCQCCGAGDTLARWNLRAGIHNTHEVYAVTKAK